MRQSKTAISGWGLIVLFFLLPYWGVGQSQELRSMLSIRQRSGYSLALPHRALMGSRSLTEVRLMGLQHYGIRGLSSIGIIINRGRSPYGNLYLNTQYFRYEEWSRGEVELGATHRITKGMYAALSIVYIGSRSAPTTFYHQINADLFLGVQVTKKLTITSVIRHIVPRPLLQKKGGSGAIALRSYYWISEDLGLVGGVRLGSETGLELSTGIGWNIRHTALVLLTYPLSGQYRFALNQRLHSRNSLTVDFFSHPVLGFSTTGGIAWCFPE